MTCVILPLHYFVCILRYYLILNQETVSSSHDLFNYSYSIYVH